jgi:pimeloyl-ACP methyl ester carboxylesterase
MEKSFCYQGRDIKYISYGSGNVIVLLHGYLESKEIWENFARRLSEKFRVICVDLPGHGSSGTYGEVHTMEFMASTLKALMEDLKIEKFFLTGHSLGGYVALAFLELFPDLLTGYCLFHSQPFADQQAAIEKRKREIDLVKAGKKNLFYPDNVERMYATPNIGKFSESLKRSKEIASVIPSEGIVAILNGMIARPSRSEIVEEGKVPLLWILGSMDNYIGTDITGKIKLPPNAEVIVLHNSGHMGFIEEEEESLKVLGKFIEKNI